MNAKLHGLFVENSDLIGLVSLPFTREVTSHSGSLRNISTDDLARRWQARATDMQHAVEKLAQEFDIEVTFSSIKASYSDVLLDQNQTAQVIISSMNRGIASSRDLNSAIKHGNILFIHDGSDEAETGFRIIQELGKKQKTVSVHCLCINEMVEREVKKTLASRQYRLHTLVIQNEFSETILEYIKHRMPGLVILPANQISPEHKTIYKEILGKLRCPLILLR